MAVEALLAASKLLSVAAIARRYAVTRECAWRWTTKGVKLKDGRMLKLRATRIGIVIRVTEEDLAAFIAAQNGGPDSAAAGSGNPPSPGVPPPQSGRAAKDEGRLDREQKDVDDLLK